MNYLAHIYLSGNDEEIMIGNFIGDYIKGSDFGFYPKKIQTGILLHRNIDLFTDTHSNVKICKAYFYRKYHKYSGIVVDILFDYFLISNWGKYTNQELSHFVRRVHSILIKYANILPEKVQEFIPSFIKNDWIRSYATIEGIEAVLHKMSKRTSLPDEADFAVEIVNEKRGLIQENFLIFFPEIIRFIENAYEFKIY